MVELLHPVTGEPAEVFERDPGKIEIHELHPREVAVVRVDVAPPDLPAVFGETIHEIEAQLTEAGVEMAGPPFTRYLEFGPARISAEIGCPVWRPAPHVGRVYPGQLPGGRIASIIHVGPYDTLEVTYDRLMSWLADLGAEAGGPMWEVYWSDPISEPDPATWRTEILVPLA